MVLVRSVMHSVDSLLTAGQSLGPREDDVALNNVTNEGKHGNPSMLNLTVTKPTNL